MFVNNLKYADGKVDSEDKLQTLLSAVEIKSVELRLQLNVKKTTCLVVIKKKHCPSCNIPIKEANEYELSTV